MAKEDPQKKIIEGEVENIFALQRTLENTEAELMENDTFRKFLEMQRTVPEQIDQTWNRIKELMIQHNIKKISGDWGSISIVPRTFFKVSDVKVLPRKFIKRSPDVAEIGKHYKLTGKAPKGAEPYQTKSLRRDIK